MMIFIKIDNEDDMKTFGESLGKLLQGGEFIELIGDVGAGKTTLVKGIAVGLGVEEQVQSPSFTISRVYNGRNNIVLAHYDFYRLKDAGIMENELKETIGDSNTITIVEWSGAVVKTLPIDRLSVNITSPTEDSREIVIDHGGDLSDKLEKQLGLL
ncbi:MAG: tRNA threonylcarbamoyladenosine biosynthesis protein TsaE [Patescibacteria group bacterium]|nr:tRNA threonylcarbamoyladenosine biosynthesis protein TsaE [Patescibacteria group bacterium]